MARKTAVFSRQAAWGVTAILVALGLFACGAGGGGTDKTGQGGGGTGASAAVSTTSGTMASSSAGAGGMASSSTTSGTMASSSTGAGGMTGASSSGTGSGGGTPVPVAPNGYYVQGNTIYDTSNQPHLFHGVARPSFEWNSMGENISLSDVMLIASWNANVIRYSLNQSFWIPGAAQYDSNYQERIDQAIQWAHQAGMDVILDLHWSDKGNLSWSAGQQRMADANSITFWKSVAQKYKGDGRVLFELYNEPHDVSWNVWLSGGDSGDGFTAAGMQQLYDAIRAEDAHNLVMIAGLNWAFDLSGVPSHRVQGHNIVYVAHPYDIGGKQPADWPAAWGFLTATDPVIITEFGTFNCSTNYYSQLIQYADMHTTSWTAWAWYPGGCGFPAVISDWQGNPNGPGQVIKTALLAY